MSIINFASMVAVAASRYTWKFNIAFMVLFTAGNLLPQQIIAVASMYVAIPTLVVYLALQRHFIAGLSLGADKG